MKTKTKKVPINEWLALKLVADEFGGVSLSRTFADMDEVKALGDYGLPDGPTSAPVCLLGIAMEAGVLPMTSIVGLQYHGLGWVSLDDMLAEAGACYAGPGYIVRIPFERAMAACGFEPALR